MSYQFKGFDWTELAECWGIKVEEQGLSLDNNLELMNDFKVPEKIEITKYINKTKMVFTVDDEEEVLAQKIKNYIWDNLDEDGFKNPQIRTDINNFLKALIEESEETDYSNPVYKGILAVEDDNTFAQWICGTLEKLWS
ncbi:hypothetical protein AAHH67_15880 [Niallia circulans]